MLGLSLGIQISVSLKSGHSSFVLSTIVDYTVFYTKGTDAM